MSSPDVKKALEILDRPKTAGHKRGKPAPHHWSAGVLLVIASVALFALLIISFGNRTPASTFQPSTEALSTEAATTASSVAGDFDQVHASDLPDSLLAQ